MNAKTAIGLLLIIIIGATVANLVALKIAADQAQKALSSGTSSISGTTAGSILGALLSTKGGG